MEELEKSRAWWPRMHSFSIGLKGAPDLPYARQVPFFLNTLHTMNTLNTLYTRCVNAKCFMYM